MTLNGLAWLSTTHGHPKIGASTSTKTCASPPSAPNDSVSAALKVAPGAGKNAVLQLPYCQIWTFCPAVTVGQRTSTTPFRKSVTYRSGFGSNVIATDPDPLPPPVLR